MNNDEQHEAHGCMVHRGLVEQRQYEAEKPMRDEIERLKAELAAMTANRDAEQEDAREKCRLWAIQCEKVLRLQDELAAEREAHERTLAGSRDNFRMWEMLKADYDAAREEANFFHKGQHKWQDRVEELEALLKETREWLPPTTGNGLLGRIDAILNAR